MVAEAARVRHDEPVPLRVLLADANELVRLGVRTVLDRESDLVLVAEACDGAEAVEQVTRWTIDVALLDVALPGVDGIRATRRIRELSPRTQVVVLAASAAERDVREALRAGACGFLLKDAPPERLVHAVRVAAAGEPLLAPAIAWRLIAAFVRRPSVDDGLPDALRGLSAREVDVMRLVARGLSNAEIGRELFLGEATVKSHVARILRKLRLRDRVQVVVAAYELGLVEPGGSAPAA